MKHFRIAVNGTSYDVEVTELDGAVSAAAAPVSTPAAPAPAPAAAPAAPAPAPKAAAPAGDGTQVTAPRYVDGTYKAQMKEFDEHGWKDYVVVQIRGDRVSVKEFDAVSKEDENKLKSQDAEMAAQMEEKTGVNPEAYTRELRSNLDAADGDPVEMDTVAGATVSSNNFRLLVGQILSTAAVNGDTEKTLEVDAYPADLGPAEEETSSSAQDAA